MGEFTTPPETIALASSVRQMAQGVHLDFDSLDNEKRDDSGRIDGFIALIEEHRSKIGAYVGEWNLADQEGIDQWEADYDEHTTINQLEHMIVDRLDRIQKMDINDPENKGFKEVINILDSLKQLMGSYSSRLDMLG